MKPIKFSKFVNPMHPGEILLEEFLAPRKLSQRQFGISIGWSARKVNEIVLGTRGISAMSALDLAEEFKFSKLHHRHAYVTV